MKKKNERFQVMKKKAKVQIGEYSDLQKQLHADIQKLITNKKYCVMNADEVMLVFGRVYSVYCIESLLATKVIKWNKRVILKKMDWKKQKKGNKR